MLFSSAYVVRTFYGLHYADFGGFCFPHINVICLWSKISALMLYLKSFSFLLPLLFKIPKCKDRETWSISPPPRKSRQGAGGVTEPSPIARNFEENHGSHKAT